MADQNSTTTKYQKLDELKAIEMIPDSTDTATILGYVTALNDVMSSVERICELKPESVNQVMMLQYYLGERLKVVLNIKYLGGEA